MSAPVSRGLVGIDLVHLVCLVGLVHPMFGMKRTRQSQYPNQTNLPVRTLSFVVRPERFVVSFTEMIG